MTEETDKEGVPGVSEAASCAVTNQEASAGGVNAGPADPTDGRAKCDWRSRYQGPALKYIRQECVYLSIIFIFSNTVIFATWYGCIYSPLTLSGSQILTLRKYLYYLSSGMLGGVTFGIKYFYRVVARGYWNQDRRIWRFLSPFLASTIAFIVGALIDASYMSSKGPVSGAAFVSIGFLSGYFADEAVGKMYDIATLIFGKTATGK